MKNKIILLSIWVSIGFSLYSQNIDKLSQEKRDSLLIELSNRVILKHGPGYYRENIIPIIKLEVMTKKDGINGKKDYRRKFYSVRYLYDKKKEQLNLEYLALILIWADTGKAFRVFFGNGIGRLDLDKQESDIQVPYEEKEIYPIYDLDNPDPMQKPKNLDELKRKGYVERDDGQWVKVCPDVPPSYNTKNE